MYILTTRQHRQPENNIPKGRGEGFAESERVFGKAHKFALNSLHLAESSIRGKLGNTEGLFAMVTLLPRQQAREFSHTSQSPSLSGTHACHKIQGPSMSV